MDECKLNFTETGERLDSRKRSQSSLGHSAEKRTPSRQLTTPVIATPPSSAHEDDDRDIECTDVPVSEWLGFQSLVAASCLPSPELTALLKPKSFGLSAGTVVAAPTPTKPPAARKRARKQLMEPTEHVNSLGIAFAPFSAQTAAIMSPPAQSDVDTFFNVARIADIASRSAGAPATTATATAFRPSILRR